MRCAATARAGLHSAAMIGGLKVSTEMACPTSRARSRSPPSCSSADQNRKYSSVVSMAGPRESRSPGSEARRSTLGHDIRRSLTNTLMPGSRVNRPIVTHASVQGGPA